MSSSSSVCCLPKVLVPQLSPRNSRFLVILNHSNSKKSRPCCFSIRASSQSSTNNDDDDSVPLPRQTQTGYDPSEDLLGLQATSTSRNDISAEPKPRSWFGPNGQYIRELPCPNCRGRGYTPCSECGIERSRSDCSLCNGKGLMTCPKCLGDCVIWEEAIDERPWERARSSSPFKVKEDDEVDSLDIKLNAKRKSKRVYQSPSPEVGLKISRSLKSLNAKTGLFSKRMRIIHRDPALHAQRVAAIKKVKGTAAARKHASETMKAFFSDPENRRKRSIAMKGVKFYCGHCGREGHRKHYCPELNDSSLERRFRCGICGEKGHNRRTCPKSNSSGIKIIIKKNQLCRICGQKGHNRRTCPKSDSSGKKSTDKRQQRCKVCHQSGHNSRTCPRFGNEKQGDKGTKKGYSTSSRTYTCRLCNQELPS